MRNTILSVCVVLLTLQSCAQNTKLHQLLNSGKEEYRLQLTNQSPDFTQAYNLFKQAVELEPGNAEARYFLGYTMDKLNSATGETIPQIRKEFTERASEQLEKVNELEPHYKGERLVQDPYSKLTSIWSSLALAYLHKQNEDSALWALKEGKKRGGFCRAMLQYNRQLLEECSPNAVLITSGDSQTFSLLYLQKIEKVRLDVTIVDAALIHSSWYSKYLKNYERLSLSYSDKEIDSLDYEQWTPTNINIINENDSSQRLQWTLYPTYYKDYVLKGDKILLDIFKQNYFKRPFYYTIPTDTSFNLFLTEHLKEEGLVLKVMSEKEDFDLWDEANQGNIESFSLEDLTKEELVRSPDVVMSFNNMRWAYVRRSQLLHQVGRKEEAEQLFKEVEIKFPLEKLPIYPPAYEKNYMGLRRMIM